MSLIETNTRAILKRYTVDIEQEIQDKRKYLDEPETVTIAFFGDEDGLSPSSSASLCGCAQPPQQRSAHTQSPHLALRGDCMDRLTGGRFAAARARW